MKVDWPLFKIYFYSYVYFLLKLGEVNNEQEPQR